MLPTQQGCILCLLPKEAGSKLKHLLFSFAVHCYKVEIQQALEMAVDHVSTSWILLPLVSPSFLLPHIRNWLLDFLHSSPRIQNLYKTGRKSQEVPEKVKQNEKSPVLICIPPKLPQTSMKPTLPGTFSYPVFEISANSLPFPSETLLFPVQSFKAFMDVS